AGPLVGLQTVGHRALRRGDVGRDAVVVVVAAGGAAGLLRIHDLGGDGHRAGRLALVVTGRRGGRGGRGRLQDVEVAGLLVALVGLAAARAAVGNLLGMAALIVLGAVAVEGGGDGFGIVVIAGVEVAALGELLVLGGLLRAGRCQRPVDLAVAGLPV